MQETLMQNVIIAISKLKINRGIEVMYFKLLQSHVRILRRRGREYRK